MESADLIMLYVPVPSKEMGLSLAKESVSQSLAACGNVLGPVSSVYEWKDKLCEEEEWILVLKTAGSKRAALKGLLEQQHPYDCPCIADWSIAANPAFASWVREQTR